MKNCKCVQDVLCEEIIGVHLSFTCFMSRFRANFADFAYRDAIINSSVLRQTETAAHHHDSPIRSTTYKNAAHDPDRDQPAPQGPHNLTTNGTATIKYGEGVCDITLQIHQQSLA